MLAGGSWCNVGGPSYRWLEPETWASDTLFVCLAEVTLGPLTSWAD